MKHETINCTPLSEANNCDSNYFQQFYKYIRQHKFIKGFSKATIKDL